MMAKKYTIIDAESLQIKLCEIMGLDPGLVASMTIRIEPMNPIEVDVTLLAEENILSADLSDFSKAVEVE